MDIKYKVLILSVLLLVIFEETIIYSYSQDINRSSFYINGGVTFPNNPDNFRDYWNEGLNFGGGIDYILTPYLSFYGMLIIILLV